MRCEKYILFILLLAILLPACGSNGGDSRADDDDSADNDSGDDDDSTHGDDDDSTHDDDDSTHDDDDSTHGDDDDSAHGDDDDSALPDWQLCGSAGGEPGQDGWTVSLNGSAGVFGDGDSTLNGGGGSLGISPSAWGLWADLGASSELSRDLEGGVLNPGSSFSLEFDNGWVEAGGEVGLRLESLADEVFRFSFSGGDSNYRVLDGAGNNQLSLPHSVDGLHLQWSLVSPTNYVLEVNDAQLHQGTLGGSGGAPVRLSVFNSAAGPGPQNHDLYINCLALLR